MKRQLLLVALCALCINTLSIKTYAQGTVTDIDGNTYQTAIIGEQEWMAENLRVSKYRNGEALLTDQSHTQWHSSTEGIWTYFDNDPTNNLLYGKLYNGYATIDPRRLCPTGWRVPSDSDWQILTNFIDPNAWGNNNTLGTKLKSRRQVNSPLGGEYNTTEHPRWDAHPTRFGTDDYGFSALLGGAYSSGMAYLHKGQYAYYWSNTDALHEQAWARIFLFSNRGMSRGKYHKDMGLSVRCIKGDDQTVTFPTVTTTSASSITLNSATSGGNVASDGGSPVSVRGVVWSTTQNPTLASNEGITTNGTGTGIFVSNLTGLTSGVTYYVRAYATNEVGTSYGNQFNFETQGQGQTYTLTLTAAPVNAGTVEGAGNYLESDEVEIVATPAQGYQFVNWSINGEIISTTSSFTYTMPAEDITIVANFEEENTITWTPCPDAPTVTDIDGNVYNTVLIGEQCWIRENLKVKHYNDGAAIITGLTNDEWYTTNTGAYGIHPYENLEGISSNEEVLQAYGALYNWYTVNNEKDVCPIGWHVPSDNEWTMLSNYISSLYSNDIGNLLRSCRQINSPIGGDCSTTQHPRWISNAIYGTDNFGFNGLPSGYKFIFGSYGSPGYETFWWSSSINSEISSWLRAIRVNSGQFERLYGHHRYGNSIRCIQNSNSQPVYHTLSTNILPEEAGIVTESGAYMENQKIALSANPNQDYLFVNWTIGSTIISTQSQFIYIMQNEDITITANFRKILTTVDGEPCPNTPTVNDVDGNVYNTVQIGEQCWIKENLKTTKYSNGNDIVNQEGSNEWLDSGNNEIGAWCWFENNNIFESYGKLYNWYAVTDERNVCPIGWHASTYDEWESLYTYLGGGTGSVGGKLKSTRTSPDSHPRWNSPNYGATNSSRFSALSGGLRENSGPFVALGIHGGWWTALEANYSTTSAWSRSMGYQHSDVSIAGYPKGYGFSVRCVKD